MMTKMIYHSQVASLYQVFVFEEAPDSSLIFLDEGSCIILVCLYVHLWQVSSETAKVLNFFGKQYLRFWPFFRSLTTSRIVLYSRPSRKPTANHLAKVIMGWLFSMPELLWKNHFDLNTLFPRHCLRHLAKKCSAWQSLSYGRSATLESPCNAAWGVFLYLPMLAQSDLICVATTISMESPSMYVYKPELHREFLQGRRLARSLPLTSILQLFSPLLQYPCVVGEEL